MRYRILLHCFAVLLIVVIAAITLRLGTTHNDFPTYYHPDEDSKIEQVRSPDRLRFTHPLLLIETSLRIAGHRHGDTKTSLYAVDDRDLVRAGREASAIFTALGVAAMTLAGYLLARWTGLLLVAASTVLCPQIIVYAHYMKEDAGLTLGLGVVFLALTILHTSTRWYARYAASMFLGVACGVAFSGKAVGAMTLVPATFAVLLAAAPDLRRWYTRLFDRLPRLLLLCLGLSASVLLLNHRAFDFSGTLPQLKPHAAATLESEIDHATSGHSGVKLTTPNTYFLRTAAELTQFHIQGLLALGLACVLATVIWRTVRYSALPHGQSDPDPQHSTSQPPPGPPPSLTPPSPPFPWTLLLSLLLTPAVFAIALSYSSIPFKRYALPLVVSAYFLAPVLVAIFMVRIPGRLSRVCLSLFTLCMFLEVQPPAARSTLDQFRNDSRQQLRNFLATLPRNTRVISDSYACVITPGDPWRFPDQPNRNALPIPRDFSRSWYAADAGSPTALSRRGVQYVVLCELNYDRYTDRDVRPEYDAPEFDRGEFNRRRQNYLDLLKCPIIWQSDDRHATRSFTNPRIIVVRLPENPPTPAPAKAPSPQRSATTAPTTSPSLPARR